MITSEKRFAILRLSYIRPWRSIFSWWFSVSKVATIKPTVKIFMSNKVYEVEDKTKIDPTKSVKSESELKQIQFLSDYRDIIWISYRCNFTGFSLSTKPAMKCYKYTCDSGWGCMIR